MYFRDRREAGRRLAERLIKYRGSDVVVLAVPRGGVIVAAEVAKALNTRNLGLIIPRKIGAPHNPELAVGAVTEDGTLVVDEDLVKLLGVGKEYIEKKKNAEIQEIKRRAKVYKTPEISLEGKVVILIDDGIATGATMKAAIVSVRKRNPLKTVVAVPVAPPESIKSIEDEVDEVVCLYTPEDFAAVGQFYERFPQTEDYEVIEILKEFTT